MKSVDRVLGSEQSATHTAIAIGLSLCLRLGKQGQEETEEKLKQHPLSDHDTTQREKERSRGVTPHHSVLLPSRSKTQREKKEAGMLHHTTSFFTLWVLSQSKRKRALALPPSFPTASARVCIQTLPYKSCWFRNGAPREIAHESRKCYRLGFSRSV